MPLEFSLNPAAPADADVDCVVVGAFADDTLSPDQEEYLRSWAPGSGS